jgi:hypothetical protein
VGASCARATSALASSRCVSRSQPYRPPAAHSIAIECHLFQESSFNECVQHLLQPRLPHPGQSAASLRQCAQPRPAHTRKKSSAAWAVPLQCCHKCSAYKIINRCREVLASAKAANGPRTLQSSLAVSTLSRSKNASVQFRTTSSDCCMPQEDDGRRKVPNPAAAP